MQTHELYVWHETLSSTTNSRFYFKPPLSRRTFVDAVRPQILALARTGKTDRPEYVPLDITTIDGYSHGLVIRWLRTEVILKNSFQEDLEADIVDAVDPVLSNALGWEASIIYELSDYREVQEKALEFGVNWSRGQLPLVGM